VQANLPKYLLLPKFQITPLNLLLLLHAPKINSSCSICCTEKNGFVTATKLGTTNNFFVAATKNFAAATERFVDRTNHFVVTKYFCYPYFDK